MTTEERRKRGIEATKRWKKRNPERVKAYKRRWAKSPAGKGRHLKFKYGITRDDFVRMEMKQGGLCRICQSSEKLVVDHDHVTGVVRGLLCHPCNKGLSFFRDDPTRLQTAIKYLKIQRIR